MQNPGKELSGPELKALLKAVSWRAEISAVEKEPWTRPEHLRLC
jgi:hypothetical protein